MNLIRIMFSLVLLAHTPQILAEPADPATRDEDISGTVLSVEYEQRADGLYEYVYSLSTPLTNKGNVGALYIDLRCDAEFPPASLPTPEEKQGFIGISAEPGTITPTVIGADYAAAAAWGIFANGHAYWGFTITPGTENPDMHLVSQAAPGLRAYVLKPSWNMDPALWDYPRDPDPTLPKRDDFAVRGLIAGPGCPGVTPPVEEKRYPGTQGRESEAVNALLTYKTPLQNRLQSDEESISFTIVYAPEIDASTFKVQPGYLRKFFSPAPGTTETVQVPLRHKRQKVMLEVHPVGTDATRQQDPEDHSRKDYDDFEIRKVTILEARK